MVDERLIDIWRYILTIMQFWVKLLKSKQSTCKSYKNVHNAVKDFDSFLFYSWNCRTVLEKLNSDKQMVPFIDFELKSIIKSLM